MIPAAVTVSNEPEYWPVPSWITNRNPPSTPMSRLRAAWVVHAPVGFVVISPRCRRRELTSMKNNTCGRRNVTGSTHKKSVAITAFALRADELSQAGPGAVGVGSIPAVRRIF